MSPKNTVMIGVGVLVLISMSQKSGTMVQGIQTSSAINAQRTEISNRGKEQRELGKAESDLAVSRYQGGCLLSSQGIGGIPSSQEFFLASSDVSLFNPGDVICNSKGATAVVTTGPNGNVLADMATVNQADWHKVSDIIQQMEAKFTLQ